MIEELHKNQINVYLDAVMNHKAGADYTEKFMAKEVNPDQREEGHQRTITRSRAGQALIFRAEKANTLISNGIGIIFPERTITTPTEKKASTRF